MVVTTYHGVQKEITPGSWVVNEYYKGFLNEVHICVSQEAAQKQKARLEEDECIKIDSPKHFSVRQIRE